MERCYSLRCCVCILGDELTIDKWFAAQAGANHSGALEDAKQLKDHQLFDMTNPNRVRSLVSRFAMNLAQFHRVDGEGYKFVADCVAELDKINGRLAAGIAKELISWKM